MKIYFSILILIQAFCPLLAQKIDFTKEQNALIVRLPTYSTKIKYLDEQINKKSLARKKRESYAKEKSRTILKKETYYSNIRNEFKKSFDACEVLFVPDTLYKKLLDGNMSVFIGDSGDITSIDLNGKKLIFILLGKDEYQLLLTDKNGNKLSEPWPYKKNTFLSFFKQLLNPDIYLYDQIIWFNHKIKMTLYQEYYK